MDLLQFALTFTLIFLCLKHKARCLNHRTRLLILRFLLNLFEPKNELSDSFRSRSLGLLLDSLGRTLRFLLNRHHARVRWRWKGLVKEQSLRINARNAEDALEGGL